MILVYLISFIIVCILLARSGSSLVKSLVKISAFLNLSDFSIAFILMAIGTSLPDFFVGISSALNGTPELSLGNLIGANIIKLTLIMGLIALVSHKVAVRGRYLFWNLLSSLGIALIPFLLLLDKKLSRLDGCILLLTFFVYIVVLLGKKKKLKKGLNDVGLKEFFKNSFLFLIGLGVLLAVSWLIVYLATKTAAALNLPLIFIGLIGVALGTSLPELTFGLKAQRSIHQEMGFGNILGSTVFNSSLILGVVSLIRPIVISEPATIWFTGLFTLFIFIIFFIFSRTREKISRLEGVILIVLYFVFVLIQVLGQGLDYFSQIE